MIETLEWNQDTTPSEILYQIFLQERKSGKSTENTIQAIAFACGKAIGMEMLLGVKRKTPQG